MSISTNRLEILRRVLIAITLAMVAVTWVWEIRDGWAVLWMGLFILVGFPAAMLTLYLRHPRWLFNYLERR